VGDLVGLNAILGGDHRPAQLGELGGQAGARGGRRLGTSRTVLSEVGGDDGVCEPCSLVRVDRPDPNVDDESAPGTPDRDALLQGFEHHRAVPGRIRFGGKCEPQPFEEAWSSPGEFRIAVEIHTLDDPFQDAVRGDDLCLALDDREEAGGVLVAGRQLLVEEVKVARVDVELRLRAVAGRQRLAAEEGRESGGDRPCEDPGRTSAQEHEQGADCTGGHRYGLNPVIRRPNI
jgi:hypothetical protein